MRPHYMCRAPLMEAPMLENIRKPGSFMTAAVYEARCSSSVWGEQIRVLTAFKAPIRIV